MPISTDIPDIPPAGRDAPLSNCEKEQAMTILGIKPLETSHHGTGHRLFGWLNVLIAGWERWCNTRASWMFFDSMSESQLADIGMRRIAGCESWRDYHEMRRPFDFEYGVPSDDLPPKVGRRV
ncbi:hypothetical protein [Mesorhizobium sp. L-8-10]|uniref:hypothetical protein n=1 Tax=Mesorhizobium sp. L-8-10 TaxID=2744523 RepID=UPI0019296303|nr:hypothetical protein [Mesorhizobium sp. L-8-10]